MPELNKKELAARYGWSMTLLNSSPELKKLFSRAVKGTWTPEKFVAELRSTKWYKRNGETARQVITLQTTDPGTYRERLRTRMADIRAAAVEVGAGLSTDRLRDVAMDSMMLGWDDTQIRFHLGDYVKRTKDGHMSGAAAAADMEIEQYARAMGLTPGKAQRTEWASDIAIGRRDLDSVKAHLMEQAENRYPQFAARFRDGVTLADIAEPYKQSMAQILELNPNQISLSDRTIQRGLSTRTDKGEPAAQPIWKFEDQLRADPRWRKTDNAKEQADSLTKKLLTDFGFLS